METLRRATIYARQDPQVAKELLTRMYARAVYSAAVGHGEALAWFDAGYLAETYKQWIGQGEPDPASGIDGYGWVKKAIGLRRRDPEMEFAAALITLDGPERAHRDHARKATWRARKMIPCCCRIWLPTSTVKPSPSCSRKRRQKGLNHELGDGEVSIWRLRAGRTKLCPKVCAGTAGEKLGICCAGWIALQLHGLLGSSRCVDRGHQF